MASGSGKEVGGKTRHGITDGMDRIAWHWQLDVSQPKGPESVSEGPEWIAPGE